MAPLKRIISIKPAVLERLNNTRDQSGMPLSYSQTIEYLYIKINELEKELQKTTDIYFAYRELATSNGLKLNQGERRVV
jgi:hypothetical protein